MIDVNNFIEFFTSIYSF